MILGCIADDFTGAGDLANMLARGGMATTQFVGVPARPARATCEAGVVSLKTRSAPIEQATGEALAALRWLKAQGCRQFLFKYCSTFDSTREGNIGPVAEALLDATGAPIAVVCPAFPATGRRVFLGHLFVGDRLLSESGMEKHPLTPMTDPDIRRWLRLPDARRDRACAPLHRAGRQRQDRRGARTRGGWPAGGSPLSTQSTTTTCSPSAERCIRQS